MWTGRVSLQHGALRFYCHGVDPGVLLLHEARYAGEGPASANADYETVNVPLHLVIDFLGSSFIMELGIGLVLELQRDK